MDNFDCTIVQFAKPVPDVVSTDQEQTQSDGGSKSFRVFLLALSSIPPDARTPVSERKDEDFSHKTIADELSSILLDRITQPKSSGWHFHQAPDWFVQGMEGYFGMTHSTPHESAVTLPLHLAAVRERPGEVVFGSGIRTGNSYLGGLALVAFLYDTYGENQMNKLLTSPKPTFDEAFADCFGDLHTVEANYVKWLAAKQ